MSDSSAAENQPEKSSSSQEQAKPRSPVERIIVWGLIIIGAGIAIYEARAKLGYNNSLSSIQSKMEANENSGAEAADLKLSDAKANLISGGPTYSELTPDFANTQLVSLTWPSLFKEYELILRLDSDQEDAIVLGYETPNAEPEPEPEVTNSSDEGDPGMMPGAPGMGAPGMGNGSGPEAGGSGRPQRPGGPGEAGAEPAKGDSPDADATPPEEPGSETDPPKEAPESEKPADPDKPETTEKSDDTTE